MLDLLQRAIAEEPSVVLRDGDVIAPGYDAELDELRRISTHTDEFLLELERRERERSGISSLKLAVQPRLGLLHRSESRSQADNVPKDYIRRQTVKNAERFITPELKGFEDKVLGAREKALAREREIYDIVLTQLTDRLGGAAGHGRRARLARYAERARRTRRGAAAGPNRSSSPRRASRFAAAVIRWSSTSSTARSCPTTWCSMPRGAC